MYLNNSYSVKIAISEEKKIFYYYHENNDPSLWNCGRYFVHVSLHVTSRLKVKASYIVPLNLRSGGKWRSGVQVGLRFNFFAKIIK